MNDAELAAAAKRLADSIQAEADRRRAQADADVRAEIAQRARWAAATEGR